VLLLLYELVVVIRDEVRDRCRWYAKTAEDVAGEEG